MSDTLALYKIKLQDFVSPQLKKMHKRLEGLRSASSKGLGGLKAKGLGTGLKSSEGAINALNLSIRGLTKSIEKLNHNGIRINTDQAVEGLDDVTERTKKTKRGFSRLSGSISRVNKLGRFAGIRTGLSSINSGMRALGGLNPLVAGVGLAAVGVYRLGSSLSETSREMQENIRLTNLYIDTARGVSVLGNSVNGLVAQTSSLNKTFGVDYLNTLRTANKLSKQFGITNSKATKLIGKGLALNGGDARLLDVLSSTSKAFNKLGLSATQQIAIVNQSVGDVGDDLPSLIEGLAANLPNFGNDVSRLLNLNYGGGFAQKLKADLSNGKVSAIEGMKAISEAISNTKLGKGAFDGLALQIFGKNSDEAKAFLKNFKNYDLSLDSISSKSGKINALKLEQVALNERLAKAQMKHSENISVLSAKVGNMTTKFKIWGYESFNNFASGLDEIGYKLGLIRREADKPYIMSAQLKEKVKKTDKFINNIAFGGLTRKPPMLAHKDTKANKGIIKLFKSVGKQNKDDSKPFELSKSTTGLETKTRNDFNRSTEKIIAGGSQVRNITVNVGGMKGADKIVIEGAQGLNFREVEQTMLDMLIRLVQGTERTLNRG